MGRTIITFVAITRRVYAEKALKTATDKLSLLSRIAKDHLQRTVDQMAETVKNAEAHCDDAVARVFFSQMRIHATNLHASSNSRNHIKISGFPLRHAGYSENT